MMQKSCGESELCAVKARKASLSSVVKQMNGENGKARGREIA